MLIVPVGVKKKPKIPSDTVKKAPTGIVKLTEADAFQFKRAVRNRQAVNGHWLFDTPMCNDREVGFIYLVHDTNTDKMYIGKKQYKGEKGASRGQESNWKWYITSCDKLRESMKLSDGGFIFYVLDEYHMKGTLGYAETWSLMYVEAPYNKSKWYNTLVNKVSWAVKEPISSKHRFRLNEILAGRGLELPALET